MHLQKLVENLREVQPVVIPRFYVSDVQEQVVSYELHGFCDAPIKAYAAVVYLRIITPNTSHVRLVISKARVAPLAKQTIPRLELLSALVLARLMNVTQKALESVIEISKIHCWTDSKVALYWITQQEKEWKQYVQSRVEEIRGLVAAAHWSHCPGVENPADIPSRGILPTQRVRHLNDVIEHFWRRWRNEYLVELRNAHKSPKKVVERSLVKVGDIVLVHDENHPRSFWRIGRIKELVNSAEGDGKSRGAVVRVVSKKGKVTTLRRPLQLLYPMEINCKLVKDVIQSEQENDAQESTEAARPRRKAAIAGELLTRQWIEDMNKF